jgi:hypothetical protein
MCAIGSDGRKLLRGGIQFGGDTFNVVAMTPYPCALPPGLNHPLHGRAITPANFIEGVFAETKRLYLTDKPQTIHFTRVSYGTMADYMAEDLRIRTINSCKMFH